MSSPDTGIQDAGTDGSDDAGSRLSTAELLQLAIDAMDAQAQVVEQICECGRCEDTILITFEEARCFLAQGRR